MLILAKIHKLLLSGNYIYRLHIYDKLEEINQRRGTQLTTDDVRAAIQNGKIIEIQDNDPRGRKYIIEGTALNEITILEIVCRIEGNLIIITVYEAYF